MKILFVLGILVSAFGTPAEAQNYPWCAHLMKGNMNCGFVSFEQCMTTVQGEGGFCEKNTLYQPATGPHSSTKTQTQH